MCARGYGRASHELRTGCVVLRLRCQCAGARFEEIRHFLRPHSILSRQRSDGCGQTELAAQKGGGCGGGAGLMGHAWRVDAWRRVLGDSPLGSSCQRNVRCGSAQLRVAVPVRVGRDRGAQTQIMLQRNRGARAHRDTDQRPAGTGSSTNKRSSRKEGRERAKRESNRWPETGQSRRADRLTADELRSVGHEGQRNGELGCMRPSRESSTPPLSV